MLRLISDENIEDAIVDGLRRRLEDLDLVTVTELGMRSQPDDVLLTWAAEHDHIMLSHDRRTMEHEAYERVRAGLPMPGLFLLRPRTSYGQAIEAVVIALLCCEEGEWKDRVLHLPL